jgi:hypothetical protein
VGKEIGRREKRKEQGARGRGEKRKGQRTESKEKREKI